MKSLYTTARVLAMGASLALAGIALGQTASAPPPTQSSQKDVDSSAVYATGKPLATQSNEGFWGHANPFARKKWVNRQVEPIKGRLNELDELTAKNANDIKDVDSRAQAGIGAANRTATVADQHAVDAGNRAQQAQGMALSASDRAGALGTTVSNLDQYQSVSDAEIRFRSGPTVLSLKAKAELDQLATQLSGQKGYILQVQGYTPVRGTAGVASSQKMADTVVRYMVEKHNVPLYRIYRVGLGNSKPGSGTGDDRNLHGSVVDVTLMQNSLASLNQADAGVTNDASPIGATQTAK